MSITTNGSLNGTPRSGGGGLLDASVVGTSLFNQTPELAAQASGWARASGGRAFETSADGTPRFSQGDAEWGHITLRRSRRDPKAGSALTAAAMVLSKLGGRVITPLELDEWLHTHDGYDASGGLDWKVAARKAGLDAERRDWSLAPIQQQVQAGRPVVVGVDFEAGGDANGTDHFIVITGYHQEHGSDTYAAIDPATGRMISFTPDADTLVGDFTASTWTHPYRTTRVLWVFTRGLERPTSPARDIAPVQDSVPSVPQGDLLFGTNGDEVHKLQAALIQLGFLAPEDMKTGPGRYGPRTRKAVERLQERYGIDGKGGGYFGQKSRAALERAIQEQFRLGRAHSAPLLPQADLRFAASNEEVKKLQRALVQLELLTQADMDTGPGKYGRRTCSAVTELQRRYGVDEGGEYFGPRSRAALKQALQGKQPSAAKASSNARVAPAPATGYLFLRQDLRAVSLIPGSRLKLRDGAKQAEKSTTDTWNRYGGLLEPLCAEMGVDLASAIAILCVESAGGGFEKGRMKIRFENHVFESQWGKAGAGMFGHYFSYDATRRWMGHRFRASPSSPWETCHTSQNHEWKVLEFARGLDETAALRSISMGAPQLMGFNHTSIGYGSVREMFDAFSADIRYHLLGLFDFIKGSGESSPMLQALRSRNFVAFATRYNGKGQAPQYAQRLQQYHDAFRSVWH